STISSRKWLADPGVEIPESAAKVHGITTEYAREHGRPHVEVVHEVATELRECWDEHRVVAIYNAAYDLTVLHTQTDGSFTVDGPVVDPFVLITEFDKRTGNRRLSTMCERYRVTLNDAHDAEADALAAARLAWKLPRRFPTLARLGVDELMRWQSEFYRIHQQQAKARQQAFFGNTDSVDDAWPILTAANRAEAQP
ncbi:DNA polymerase-3 subunit alpha/DNA polymerase-3 subunit epsilon, partial [Rhodococcus rhodochrous J38]|uniref:exonuclease domain-containing protein n=1 Tax=Rhodococcus rhodochrous TaxID=1829 RepID=UPI0011AA36D6